MKIIPLLFLWFFCISTAFADNGEIFKSVVEPTTAISPCDPLEKGTFEFAASSASMFSPVFCANKRPTLNYVQGDASLGIMLTSPEPLFGSECLRGNWEALANLFAAGVVRGPNGFMAGGRALIRYNFAQPGAKWVPFLQLGAGILGDNIYRHDDQRLVGNGMEFTLVADLGMRYFFTPKCAALVTLDFEHVSNADTAFRNVGVNALGGGFGISWFFQ